MFIKIAVFFVVFAAASAVRIMNCGSTAKIVNVDITGCDGPRRCIFKKGENASIILDFIPSAAEQQVNVKVYGIIAGVDVPFNFPEPDGCQHSGLTCPLQPNQQARYTSSLPVSPSYPSLLGG